VAVEIVVATAAVAVEAAAAGNRSPARSSRALHPLA